MDRPGPLRNVFSRGGTPPGSQLLDQTLPPAQHAQQYQHASPSQSIREVPASSPNHVESLFSNLSGHSGQPSTAYASSITGPSQGNNSGPATPVSVTAQSVSSSTSAHANPQSSDSRQSALLSLLGTVSPSGSQAPPPQQQIPTPPNVTHSSGSNANNESQGRMLLEQLMSGGTPRANYNTQPPVMSSSSSGYVPYPSAPYPPAPYPPVEHPQQHDASSYYEPESVASQEVPIHDTQSPQGPQQSSPSPPKSMFDFVSPFDALASSSRKPAPSAGQPGLSTVDPEGWPAVVDPKRKSVDNLIEQLTRAQPSSQAIPPYAHHPSPGEEGPSPEPKMQSRPLPPKPVQAPSPRSSPPKVAPQQQRRDTRQSESPLGSLVAPPLSHVPAAQGQREKESSPGPRGGWKNQDGRSRGSGSKAKSHLSPNAQPQNIVFDVTQPLDEIQAPRDAVKSTAIALVRVDSSFLPGTTIGATHWVAYAMTKGRVRVISRSSGDRTLLQLPAVFPQTTSVTDMAVYGNRLAGVTSDGGLVVWELPEVITDDVPGRILLCILPTLGPEALHSVKWHPRQQDILAVASETSVYMLNIIETYRMFGGDAIDQMDLPRAFQPIRMSSALLAFEFDINNNAVATVFDDSTLTLFGIRDRLPFWSTKIKGEGTPSSITFVDGGLVLGRKHGTVFQLLQTLGKNVLATIKFINGDQEDPDMFGHANYDARIQTLWVANSRRDSMIAFKLGFDAASPGRGEDIRGYFEQVVEFAGPKPTIHFVILTADADPTGEEAHAACVAAKVPPGELALVAFSVHSTGVDQVLIRREWFDGALASSVAKFPSTPLSQAPPAPAPEPRVQRQAPPPAATQPLAHPSPVPPVRLRTPPSEEVEPDLGREEGKPAEGRGRGKGKNVGWKEKEREERERASKASESNNGNGNGSDSMSKELKKMEENLYTRIGRLVSKELDKQQQRLEELRVSEQAADFARQEKILKLISNELTKNTTRVVEMAVKSEVQNSVLPSLENITKNEVKAALSGQIAKGLGDTMNKALPSEIERLLFRSDVSAHIARTFSSAITPIIERHVKDAINQTLIPTYTQQSSAMHQDLSREIQNEMLSVKKEVIAWQSEALRGQEATIRDLEQSVRALSDQIKYLSMNAGARRPSTPPVGNPGSIIPFNQQQQHARQVGPPAGMQSQVYGPMPPPQQMSHAPPPQGMQGQWFPSGIPAPQASHPALPPPTHGPAHHSPHSQQEEWDDTYLGVLGTQDPRQLRELLARSNPEVIMPLKGPSPLSQAVVLTLVHRLAAAIGESAPVDESFKSSLWWLQRASAVLNTNDPVISPYASRVLPTVQQMLNTTKSRIAIIPNAPQALETARSISDIQEILSRKPV